MILVLLERLERLQARILIVESDDIAHVDAIIVQMIEEAAGVGLRVHRPAQGMFNAAGALPPGRQLPQFLVAQGERLRTVPFGKSEFLDELLGNRSATA